MDCRHREYAVKVPEGQEAFMQALTAFYAEYETDLPKPVVCQYPIHGCCSVYPPSSKHLPCVVQTYTAPIK